MLEEKWSIPVTQSLGTAALNMAVTDYVQMMLNLKSCNTNLNWECRKSRRGIQAAYRIKGQLVCSRKRFRMSVQLIFTEKRFQRLERKKGIKIDRIFKILKDIKKKVFLN